MKNTAKGKKDFLHSSPSPSLLSKIGSIFSNHTSSSYPPSSILPRKPVSYYKSHTTPSSSTSTKPSNPVSHQKIHTTPSSSSSTKMKKPVPKHNGPSAASKQNTNSSSSTKMKKPVPKHNGPSAASKQNTNPSISEAAWALAAGAGKLAFFVGKTAAIVTTEVVKGGIEIAHNQIEHNEKLKETFVCYYTDPKRKDYQGTLHFSDNQIVFSTNQALPPHTTSSYKKKDPKPKVEIKIPFQEVIEINQRNAENPSTRYIQIRGVLGSYTFWGFDDYYKTYNHIYSLLPSSS